MIEQAIAGASLRDGASSRDARHVLLSQDRKEIYDRTRTVVVCIGQLRANLGLSRSPHWLASDCADFDANPSSSPSQLDALRARARAASVSSVRPRRRTLSDAALAWFSVLAFTFVVGGVPYLALRKLREPPIPTLSPEGRTAKDETISDEVLNRLAEAATAGANREEKLRTLVTKRYYRDGHNPHDESGGSEIELYVAKLLKNEPDSLPSTGVLERYSNADSVAPLGIKTKVGSNYYLKVVDWNSGRPLLTAFIRGGEPFETTVPIGSYKLKYASGQSWFGEVLDFGEGASYSRCEDRFDFTRDSSGYSGYTVELILQRNGNLKTTPMAPDDF